MAGPALPPGFEPFTPIAPSVSALPPGFEPFDAAGIPASAPLPPVKPADIAAAQTLAPARPAPQPAPVPVAPVAPIGIPSNVPLPPPAPADIRPGQNVDIRIKAPAVPDPDSVIRQQNADDAGVIDRSTSALKRGVTGLMQSGNVLQLRVNTRELDRLDQIEKRLQAGESPDSFKDEEDPTGVRYISAQDRQAYRDLLVKSIGSAIGGVAEKERENQQNPAPRLVSDFTNAKSFGDAWTAFKKAPFQIIATVGTESLPQALPGMAAAIPAGMVAGPFGVAGAMGANSYGTDYLSGILDGLRDEKIDVTDKAAVEKAVQDKALMERVATKAHAHAAVVGAFDALSGGIAGKSLVPARVLAGRQGTREAANLALQAPVQGALGAAGEAGGQIAAGDELKPGQIAAEAAGEFFGAPAEVAAAALSKGRAHLRERRGAVAPGRSTSEEITQFIDKANENPAAGAFTSGPARTMNAPLALAAPIPEGFEPMPAAAAPTPSPAQSTPAPAPATPAEAPKTSSQESEPAQAPRRAVPADEAAIAKAAGFDVETVAGMSRLERKRIVQQAREDGIEPAELTPEERTLISGEGTRAAPVRAETAADVEKAVEHVADPTPAQAEAGNYKKAHLDVQGLPVTIETPAGAERRGTDENGEPWAHKIESHYGYVKGTEGADGDHVDTYVGPNPASTSVTIIDQKDPKTGKFDEHKVVLGTDSEAEAKKVYEGGFNDGSGPSRIAAATTVSMPEFKEWLDNGDHTKPAAGQLDTNPRTAGYDRNPEDPLRGRMDYLKQRLAKGGLAPKTEKEFARRIREFEGYTENRDAALEKVDPKLANQIRRLRADDRVTGINKEGDRVTGRVEGWGKQGLVGVSDDEGIHHEVMVKDIESVQPTADAGQLGTTRKDVESSASNPGEKIDTPQGAVDKTAPKSAPVAKQPAAPKSLAAFLASRGGLKPNPELDHLDLTSHFVPGHGRLVRKTGMDLDKAREAAVEAGYLPEADANAPATSRPRDLLDALEKEGRGDRQFKAGDETAAADQSAKRRRSQITEEQEHQARSDIVEALAEIGLPERELDQEALDRASRMLSRGDVSNVEDAYERAVMSVAAEHENTARAVEKGGGLKIAEWVQAEPPEGWSDEASNARTETRGSTSAEAGEAGDGQHAGGPDKQAGERADGPREVAAAPSAEAGRRNDPQGRPTAADLDAEIAAENRERGRLAYVQSQPPIPPSNLSAEAKIAWKEGWQSARAIGVSVGSATRVKDKAEAQLRGGQFTAVARREKPWSAERGYGDTPEAAQADALRRLGTEPGADGKPQTVIPGAEKISDRELAERKAEAPLRGKGEQRDVGGLFGDDAAQTDLMDLARAPEPAEYETAKAIADRYGMSPGKGEPASYFRNGTADGRDAYVKVRGHANGLTVSWSRQNPNDIGWTGSSTKVSDEAGAVRALDAAFDRYGWEKPAAKHPGLIIKSLATGKETHITVAEDSVGERLSVGDTVEHENMAGDTVTGTIAAIINDASLKDADAGKAGPVRVEVASATGHIGRFEPEALMKVERPSLSDAFRDHFAAKRGFKNILEARRFAKEHDGTTDTKAIEEALEAGLVQAARGIVEEAKSPAQAFNRLVAMYERQPTLGTRTSQSIKDQAYSTPVPLAYVAAKLAGIGEQTTVLEPTAGNGALLITAAPKNVRANEINPERAAALREQGFGTVLSVDASETLPGKPVDVVIANPPFGPVKEKGETKRFDMGDVQPGYSTNEIDHVISLRALESMAPTGRAALIIGAPNAQKDRAEGYNGKAKREFFKVLYDRYNVTDHFTVSGDLYAKQGAGWPVDVIIIDGKGASSRKVPAANVPPVLSTWADLKEKLNDLPADTHSRVEQARGAPFVPEATRAPARDGADRPAVGGGERVVVQPPAVEPAPVRPGHDREQRGPAAGESVAREREEHSVRAEPVRPDRVAPAERRPPPVATGENARQVSYQPGSTGTKSLGTLVPVNMRSAINDALDAVRERRGDLDTYVARGIGLKRGEDLGEYFGAEQVDALALGIDNAERGGALIIGDQTGIGKGRVNAGMIRYALASGKIPIFFTEKPNLYAAMYDDLTATGIQTFLGREPKILMTDAAKSLTLDDAKGIRLKTPEAKKHNADLRALAETGGIGDHDIVFTTYSGAQTIAGAKTDRQRFLEAIAGRSLPIMDESHNAGGAGAAATEFKGKVKEGEETGLSRAKFLRQVIDAAPAAFYSSATYAKRPDIMDLYRKTDMRLAVDDIEQLAEAINAGGVPMQQVVASMTAQAGQYIRRERSFDGISYDVEKIPVSREVYDGFSGSLAAIQRFAELVGKHAKQLDKDLREDAARAGQDASVGEAGASSTNFTSVMHNVVSQMLLSIKAEETAARSIAHIKAGRKPVIALSNTLESFLTEYADTMGLNVGDAIALDFGALLNRYLDRSRVITIRKPFMKQGETAEKKVLELKDMDPVMRAAYKAAADKIASVDFGGLPVSPIDHIKARIQQAGYKVGEITGRDMVVDYTQGTPRLASRGSKERSVEGRRKANVDFNSGALDAMILNQAGSTGISLHAGEKFKDQRKRVMLIAQAPGDINTHMQMLGRVHRTGQVTLPSFEQLAADIPAETRPAAVLAKKMASLNANTTAARDSVFTSEDVPDFINAYGDKVAANVMMDEIELNEAMGRPVSMEENTGNEGAMRKLTGRIPLLPLAEQERLYDRLISSYRDLIDQLDAAGQNMLEAKTLDLDARLVSEAEIQKQSGPSPFQGSVQLGTYNIKRQGKPYSARDVVQDAMRAADPSEVDSIPEGTNLPKLLARVGREGAKRQEATREETRNRFATFQGDYLQSIADPERADAQRTKLNDQDFRYRDISELTYPGAQVRLTFHGGETGSAIALGTVQAKGTKNPVALGSWKVTFASPTDGRKLTFPYSQIITQGTPEEDQVLVGPAQTWVESTEQTLEAFDRLAKGGAREDRVIATGNLLSGFTKINGKGQIINFTTANGEVRQGIMMSAKAGSLDDVLGTMRKPLDAPGVADWLRTNPRVPLSSTDGAVTLFSQGERYAMTTVSIEKSKKTGGRYYLDDAVLLETGNFVSRGGKMTVELGQARVEPTVQALQNAGARFEIEATPEDVKVTAAKVQAEIADARAQSAPNGWGQAEPGPSAIEQATTADTEVADRAGGALKLFYEGGNRAQREAIADQVAKIVAEIAPIGVSTEVPDAAALDSRSAREAYGDTGQGGFQLANGVFYGRPSGVAAIVVAMTSPNKINTAFHESWHAVKWSMGVREAEQRVLDRERPRLYRLIQAMKPDMTLAQMEAMSQEEVEAQAAGAWGAGYRVGQHFVVVRFLDAVSRLINRVRNLLAGYGFTSYESIFSDFAAGEFRRRSMTPENIARTREAIIREQQQSAAGIQAELATPPARSEEPRRSIATTIRNQIGAVFEAAFPEDRRINATERFQNMNVRMKRLQETLEQRQNAPFSSSRDFWAKRRLMGGAKNHLVEEFDKTLRQPLFDAIRDSGMALSEVGDALYAHHAPERNARMDEINEPGWHAEGRGSGMSNEEAERILAKVQADGKRIALDRILDAVKAIQTYVLDTLEEGGVLSEAQRQAWEADYTNYIPLRGFENPLDASRVLGDDPQPVGVGKFSERGRASPQALGRRSKADNPLVNVLDQAYRAIHRAERNKVLQSLWSALKSFRPGDISDLVKLDKGDMIRVFDEASGMVREVPDNKFANDPRAVGVKIGGKQHFMVFDDPRVAAGIVASSPDAVPGVLRHLLRVIRFVNRFRTTYQPDFLVTQFLFRGPQQAIENFLANKDAHNVSVSRLAREGFPFIGKAHRAIRAVQQGQDGGAYGAAWREMQAMGGAMSFGNMNDADRIRGDFTKALDGISSNPLKRSRAQLRAFKAGFEAITDALDNAYRLAAYVQAKEAGFTKQQAAVEARDLLGDFAMRGRTNEWATLWFEFFNAGIQASAVALSRAARSKYTRRALVGAVVFGAVTELSNYLLGGSDDKDDKPWMDKYPDYERNAKRIILIPGTQKEDGSPRDVKIPMEFGIFGFAVNSGAAMVQSALSTRSAGKIAKELAESALETVNPFGGAGYANLASKLTPAPARSFEELYANRNFANFRIHSEATRDPRPHSEQGRRDTGPGWKAIAAGVNRATGGSEFVPGYVSLYPEDYRHLSDWAFGAQRRTGANLIEVGKSVGKGEVPDPKNVPGLRVVTGNDAKRSDRSAFYDARTEVNEAKDAIKNAQATRSQEAVVSVRKSYPLQIEFIGRFEAAQKGVSALEKQVVRVTKDDKLPAIDRDAEVKRLEQKQMDIMNAVRVAYEKRKRRAT